jgi:spore germination cell wall hydrolase CwlJ-like protein
MNKWLIGLCIGVVLLFMFRIEDRLDVIQSQVEDLNHIVKSDRHVQYTTHDVDCMAKNIYYEAGVESKLGKYAVGHITMNRLDTGYWGKTVCQVVYAKDQFSWTRLKKLPKPDPAGWAEAQSIAWDVIHGYQVKSLAKSLFYHADYIKDPHWADHAHKVTQIGRHIFYNKAKNSWLEL